MEKNGNKRIDKTIDELENIINYLGKFKYEKNSDGIKIYGYK